MKRLIVAILFILTIFLIDRGGAFIMDKLLSKSKFRYAKMYKGKVDGDIAIIGNSRGVNGFYAPFLEKELGLKVDNISYNGLKTELTTILAQDYIDKKNPKMLIVEGSLLFNVPRDTSLLKDFKLYSDDSPRIQSLLDKQAHKDFVATKIFKLYQYNTNFFYRNIFYIGRSDKTWINNYQLSSKLIKVTEEMPEFDMDIDKESVQMLKVFMEENEDIDIRIIITPYLPIYKQKMKGFDEGVAYMENELGIKVLDYSDTLKDETYFGDRVHSNKKGAIELGGTMIKEGIFTVKTELK